MVNTLIFIFILICILYALWVSGVFTKVSQTQQQAGQNVGNQPQQQVNQQTPVYSGDKWLPLKVAGSILLVFVFIWFLSWVLNGESNYNLKEGRIYSQKISFGDKFNFSGNGKKFYASTDGVVWVLVGAGEPRHEFGKRVNIFYMKYYEPKTKVTVKVD